MATAFSNQLTKQVGEYLVAAELARRGYICTTFAGTVPHFDIIAVNETGHFLLVQVKAVRGGDWQFDIREFVEAWLEGKKQNLGALRNPPYPNLIFVFVRLRAQGQDEFYILPYTELQEIVNKDYDEYLKKHNGIRPKKPDSFHTAVRTSMLKDYRDRWSYFDRPSNNDAKQLG